MKSISIYAITRKQNLAQLSRMERQLSKREKPLKMREWELDSLKNLVEQLESRISLYYDLPGKLYIRSVETNSDAYAQGIRSGDIITAIDGQEVYTVDEFNRIKNEYSAGDQIPLTIFRSGHNYEVTVTLMDRADLD